MLVSLAALAPIAVVACDARELAQTDDDGARARGRAVGGGSVVSTVDGWPIDVALVRDAARAAEVPPRVALSRLEDEALLAARAERAGLGDDPEVVRGSRRAAVQALLEREVEARVTADAIDPAELEAAYAAAPERFARPERRRSVHVLARVPDGAPSSVDDAAEAWIRELHARLSRSERPEADVLALRRRAEADEPFAITIEEVPPLSRTDAADPSYLAALFATPSPGVTPEPVRSAFGWHAVVVTEIVPAWHADHDEAIGILRDERLAALRAARLEELVRELAQQARPSVDDAAARRAFGLIPESAE